MPVIGFDQVVTAYMVSRRLDPFGGVCDHFKNMYGYLFSAHHDRGNK